MSPKWCQTLPKSSELDPTWSEPTIFGPTLDLCIPRIAQKPPLGPQNNTVVMTFLWGTRRRFNLWECAVGGCVWKCPEWFWVCVFSNFDEGPDDFWTGLAPLDPFLTLSEPFFDPIGYIGPFWGHFGTKTEPFWGDLGVTLGWFWTIFGSIPDHFGVT